MEEKAATMICLEQNIGMIDACIKVVKIDKRKNKGDFLSRRQSRMECFLKASEVQENCRKGLMKEDLAGTLKLNCQETVRFHAELMCELHTPEN